MGVRDVVQVSRSPRLSSEAGLTGLCPFLIFGRPEGNPRYGIEQTDVVVDQPHARNVLGRDNDRLPEALVGNDAAEMYDPIAYDNAEPQWLPFTVFDCGDHAFPDVIIVGRRIRNIPGETCDSPKKIRARHDPDERISAHDRQTPDTPTFHQLNGILKQHILCSRAEIHRRVS